MDNREAIELHLEECKNRIEKIKGFMESNSDANTAECSKNIRVLESVIQAIEELEQYRELGTVEEIKSMMDNGAFTGIELAQLAAMQMKLKEYQQLGTLEQVREVVERSKPKKPIIISLQKDKKNDVVEIEWKCPVCSLSVIEETPCQCYCERCGNKLDWSDEE